MIRARTTLSLLAVVGLLATTAAAPGAAVAGGDDVDSSGPAELSPNPSNDDPCKTNGVGALCGGGGGCSLCPDPYKICC